MTDSEINMENRGRENWSSPRTMDMKRRKDLPFRQKQENNNVIVL